MYKSCFDPSSFNPFAVEGSCATGTKGIVPVAGQEQTDPDWQPLQPRHHPHSVPHGGCFPLPARGFFRPRTGQDCGSRPFIILPGTKPEHPGQN